MMKRCLAMVLVALLLAPSLALAQASKAGVVTTLEGNVTARRVALPDAVPLKFKSDVFLQDQVATGDKSLARMLLGGKAVVTVRERSLLTITEVPGKSTIDLESGKFSLAVAREKMRPDEEILIRTPNAVAGVRGTVVVTEVNRQGAQLTGAPAVVTNFYVLRGTITAQQLDPTTKQPIGTVLNVGTLQAYTGAGTAPPRIAPVPPEQVGQIIAGLTPSGPKGGSEAGKEQVKAQAVQGAVALLTALTGGTSDTQFALGTAPTLTTGVLTPTTSTAPIIPPVSTTLAEDQVKALIAALQALINLLLLTGSVTVAANTPFRTFSGTFNSTSISALIQLTNAIVIQSGADFITVPSGANVTLAGPLANLTNSTLSTTGSLLNIAGGSLTSTTTSPLFTLDPSSITTGDALIVLNGGTLTLAGALLKDTSGTITAAKEFLRMTNATLTDTGTDALIQLSGTTVNGTSALSMTGSTMTLAGPLASMTSVGGTTSKGSGNNTLFFLDNSSLTSTTTSPLITFTSTSATPGGGFFRLVKASKVSLAGPLFSQSTGSLGSGSSSSLFATFSTLDGSTLTSTSTSSLISLTSVTEDSQGPLFNIRRSPSTSSPSTVTLAGPLLSATSSTFNTTSTAFNATFGSTQSCCSMFSITQGGILKSTTSSPLISFTDSTATVSDSASGGSFFAVADTFTGAPSSELVAASSMTLAGPLLSASNSTIKPLFSLLQVSRSTVTDSSTSALISITGGSVTAGGTDISGSAVTGRLLEVISTKSPFGTAASPSSLSLAGPLLSATSTSFTGNQLIGVFGGATLKSTTASPLVSLDSTSLTLTALASDSNHGSAFAVEGLGGSSGSGFATITLSGPLLSTTNGTLTVPGSFVNVQAGGRIIESHPTSPFVSITGGTHALGTDSGRAIFELRGRSTATATEVQQGTTLTLGTDQPLQRSGSGAFLAMSGATITTNQSALLDFVLVSASAPLLDIKSNSSLTSATNGIDLAANAKLTTVGPMVKLDSSTLTITSGAAIRVTGGSFLNVSGDLFSLSNSALLKISNGQPLFVSGNSVVVISGAFVNFGGSGNVISINSPTLCVSICSSSGGINFLTQNGASVSISGTAIKNSGGGSITNVSGSLTPAIIADGANTKVVIQGN